MASVSEKIATVTGMGIFLGGIFGTATAVTFVFSPEATELFGQMPTSIFLALLLGGMPIGFIGAAIGIRYGNFERYHKDYNSDTGKIDSSHPFSKFAEFVKKEDDEQTESPEKWVPTRTYIAGVSLLPAIVLFGAMLWMKMPLFIFGVLAIVMVPSTIVGFYVADLVAKEMHDGYPPESSD